MSSSHLTIVPDEIVDAEIVADEPPEPKLIGTKTGLLDGAINVAIRQSVDACSAWAEIELFGIKGNGVAEDEDASAPVAALWLVRAQWEEIFAYEPHKNCPKSLLTIVDEARKFFDGLPAYEDHYDSRAAEALLVYMGLADRWRKLQHTYTVGKLRRKAKKPGKEGKQARKDLSFYRFGRKVFNYVGKLEHQKRQQRLADEHGRALIAEMAMRVEV